MARFKKHPLLRLGFHGPWRVIEPGRPERRCEHYESLVHWIESSKFDPSLSYDLAQAVRLMPTNHTAIKFTGQREVLWRSDWRLIATDVIAQGIKQLQMAHPRMTLWGDPEEMGENLTQALMEIETPEWMVSAAVQRAVAQRDAPRVAVLGASRAPHREVGRRIGALHRRLQGAWVLVNWVGRHGSEAVHDWADKHRIGVVTIGEAGSRLNRHTLASVLAQCTQVLFFEQRGAKAMEASVRRARAADVAVEVVSWDEMGASAAPAAPPSDPLAGSAGIGGRKDTNGGDKRGGNGSPSTGGQAGLF